MGVALWPWGWPDGGSSWKSPWPYPFSCFLIPRPSTLLPLNPLFFLSFSLCFPFQLFLFFFFSSYVIFATQINPSISTPNASFGTRRVGPPRLGRTHLCLALSLRRLLPRVLTPPRQMAKDFFFF